MSSFLHTQQEKHTNWYVFKVSSRPLFYSGDSQIRMRNRSRLSASGWMRIESSINWRSRRARSSSSRILATCRRDCIRWSQSPSTSIKPGFRPGSGIPIGRGSWCVIIKDADADKDTSIFVSIVVRTSTLSFHIPFCSPLSTSPTFWNHVWTFLTALSGK
jgi:hypothetical protein